LTKYGVHLLTGSDVIIAVT